MVVFSILNGAFMPKLGYVTPWYVLGSALVLIGSALMCKFWCSSNTTILPLIYKIDTVNPDTSTSNIYGYTILVGAGSGCYLVAGFAIVQSLVPIKDIANAVGAMTICKTDTPRPQPSFPPLHLLLPPSTLHFPSNPYLPQNSPRPRHDRLPRHLRHPLPKPLPHQHRPRPTQRLPRPNRRPDRRHEQPDLQELVRRG